MCDKLKQMQIASNGDKQQTTNFKEGKVKNVAVVAKTYIFIRKNRRGFRSIAEMELKNITFYFVHRGPC